MRVNERERDRECVCDQVATEFTTKQNMAAIVKRGKAKPAAHSNKRLYLESMMELALFTYHSFNERMSQRHFPGIQQTEMGNVFNDTHRARKFKDAEGQVINKAEVSGGFWYWVYTTLCQPGDWALVDMCGSGTEVCMGLLAGVNMVAIDIRPDQVCSQSMPTLGLCDLSRHSRQHQ